MLHVHDHLAVPDLLVPARLIDPVDGGGGNTGVEQVTVEALQVPVLDFSTEETDQLVAMLQPDHSVFEPGIVDQMVQPEHLAKGYPHLLSVGGRDDLRAVRGLETV